MSSYNHFAKIYNQLNSDINYEVRSDYISGFFIENDIKEGTILDLACGTGDMSVPFLENGYNIIGIDCSEDMLQIASNKFSSVSNNFSLYKSKMQNFDLSNKVDACICCLDSINHLNSINDVNSTFNCVNNCLKDKGLFIFDVNTIYKHQDILADKTFVYDEEDFYLVWDNEKIDDRNIRILLDMFEYNGKSYNRFSEEFVETAYSIEELVSSLLSNGFGNIKVYDDLTKDKPNENSERLYFICEKV